MRGALAKSVKTGMVAIIMEAADEEISLRGTPFQRAQEARKPGGQEARRPGGQEA
jgi:hypothetical protein